MFRCLRFGSPAPRAALEQVAVVQEAVEHGADGRQSTSMMVNSPACNGTVISTFSSLRGPTFFGRINPRFAYSARLVKNTTFAWRGVGWGWLLRRAHLILVPGQQGEDEIYPLRPADAKDIKDPSKLATSEIRP